MGKAELKELEELTKSEDLIAWMKYDNPQRKKDVFYNFIWEFATEFGVPMHEKNVGLIDEKKKHFDVVKTMITDSDYHLSHRLAYGIVCGLNLILPPIAYPLFGSTGSVMDFEESITINIPRFMGIRGLFLSDKPHEYMHVYHMLVAKALKLNGLLPNIGGVAEIGLMEPGYRIPTKESLKKFERRFLNAMIREEKKFL